jgi:hypothetical protein
MKGVEAVVQAGRRVYMGALEGVARGLRLWGEETITLAKEDYVPVLTGALRASGTAEMVDEGTTAPSVRLSFGGQSPAGEYAIPVHERPASHRVGEDKYLEKPALRQSRKLKETIAREVKKGIRGR